LVSLDCGQCESHGQNSRQVSALLQIWLDPYPRHHGYDAILTVIDRLSKTASLTPITLDIDAVGLAHVFPTQVFRHYGIPKSVVTDRDPRFTSNFWQALMEQLGAQLRFSTAFHPETDGQAERYNRTLQEMLRGFVNASQDDWEQHLVPLEFAYNASLNASPGYSPLYLMYGQHTLVPAALVRPPSGNSPAVDDFLQQMADTLNSAKHNLMATQEKMKKQADTRRRQLEFEVGDKVLLSTQNLNHLAELLHRVDSNQGLLRAIKSTGF
jgi:hypothetical protein